MVVAAGVHAAGDVQAQLTQIVQVVEIVETLLDGLGNGDRLGVGQRAEITTGAGDDVGEQPGVGRAQPGRFGLPP